jgi:succinate dehydrogenase / fumarate reductase cytochrome b subunit
MSNRPLSPHLSVYRFKYTLLSSILNRVTGLALAAGLVILAYWLMALASGPERYANAGMVLSHPIFKLIYAGLIFTVVYHLVAGIRHLIWDTGRYMEKRQSQTSAWLVGAVSVVVTLALIAWVFTRTGSV